MNNMIKRQALVPPWIEKQQALHTAAANFRARLRKDWTRHAVGMVVAAGGSVEEQVRRAEAYARAERGGQRGADISSTTQTSNPSDAPSEKTSQGQTGVDVSGAQEPPEKESRGQRHVDDISITQALDPSDSPSKKASRGQTGVEDVSQAPELSDLSPEKGSRGASQADPSPLPSLPPLRDPAWERQQLPYLTLAIAELNATARAYNLQAPDLAKKPYYALEREMASCFADVAIVLAREVVGGGDVPEEGKVGKGRDRGVIWRIVGEKAVVRDERGPKYGFKELWRDIFR